MIGLEWKRTVAIAAIPDLVEPLRLALEQSTAPGEEADSILRGSVSVRCIQCGASMTGESFIALSQHRTDAADGSAEVQRLGLKHCLNEACPCCFYDVHFAPVEGIDWEIIWSAAERAREDKSAKSQGPVGPWPKRLIDEYGLLGVAAVLLLVAALAFLFYTRLRTPSWARPIPVYWGHTNSRTQPMASDAK